MKLIELNFWRFPRVVDGKAVDGGGEIKRKPSIVDVRQWEEAISRMLPFITISDSPRPFRGVTRARTVEEEKRSEVDSNRKLETNRR